MPRCPTCQSELAPKTTVCPRDGTAIPPGLEGTVLGERYRLTRELGEGGMGRVYLAEHVILGKQLAVKVLRAEYSKHPELVKRFQLEAVAASQIGQENIVDVSDFGQTPDGSFYFVMEFVPGQSLAQIIDSTGPIKATRALPLLLQITKALGAAHSRGIVHRDMKPDNVLVTPRDGGGEYAKVLDFGISKVGEGQGASRITQVGMVVGTPHYMAPEQATGDPVDSRADIYAFGILSYEILTGRVPFQGENSLQILLKHQKEQPVPPSKVRPDMEIPDRLEKLILHCLEKEREGRPQNMNEVGQELAACMALLGLVSGPVSLPELAAVRSAEERNHKVTEARMGFRVTDRGPGAIDHSAKPPEPAPAPVAAPAPIPTTTDPVLNSAERAAVQRNNALPMFAVFLGLAIFGGVIFFGLRGTQRPPTTVATVPAPQPKPAPEPAKPPAPTPPAVAVAPAPEQPKQALTPTPAPVPSPKASVQRVSLRSVPAGAQVLGPEGKLGTTPLELELAAGQSREVRLIAAGYRATSRKLRAGEGVVEVHLQKVAERHTSGTPSPEADPYGKVDDLKADPYGP